MPLGQWRAPPTAAQLREEAKTFLTTLPEGSFARLDANGDGTLSRAELGC